MRITDFGTGGLRCVNIDDSVIWGINIGGSDATISDSGAIFWIAAGKSSETYFSGFTSEVSSRFGRLQAYEDLDDTTKARIENLWAKNRQPLMKSWEGQAKKTGDTKVYDWLKANFKETRTPVVRIHPVTKKKALFVSKAYTNTLEGRNQISSYGSRVSLTSAFRQPYISACPFYLFSDVDVRTANPAS